MFIYKVVRLFLKIIVTILFKPGIINKENIPNTGSVILAGNHEHSIDSALVAISTKRDIRFLAKKELHNGMFGIFFKAVKTIPVDRSKKDSNATSLAMKVLNNGEAIGLFPEGTRHKGDNILLPFKFGAVSLAKKTNSPIIPFAITGKPKLFRKGIKIEFGTPIFVGEMDDLEEANKNLMSTVEALIKKMM